MKKIHVFLSIYCECESAIIFNKIVLCVLPNENFYSNIMKRSKWFIFDKYCTVIKHLISLNCQNWKWWDQFFANNFKINDNITNGICFWIDFWHRFKCTILLFCIFFAFIMICSSSVRIKGIKVDHSL